MSNRNTPNYSTYKTQRFPLIGIPLQRSGTSLVDQRFLNVFPEVIKAPYQEFQHYYLKERPGLTYVSTGTAGTGRGIYYYNGHTYTAIGNALYQDGVSIATLGNSSGVVGFTEYSGTYNALVVLDGIKGFVIKTDLTVTEITDVDFPTPHIPAPISLDGYLFVAKSGTGDIYNSDLDTALVWTAGNFISTEMYPDNVVTLVKNNNYLCAVGSDSIEYFYDAANVSGSPLARNDSTVHQIGSVGIGTVASTDKQTILVGKASKEGGRTLWLLDGFNLKELSIEPLKQSLNAEGSNISSASALIIRISGHKFYILNITNRTWVYDMEESLLHEWTYSNTTTKFCCDYASDSGLGYPIFLHRTNGNVLRFSESSSTDTIDTGAAIAIPVVITTEKQDFESLNQKFCYRFSLLTDIVSPDGDVTCSIQWSDDDYVSWSTARTLTMTSTRPEIMQLGVFRRRAFRISYSGVYPVRFISYELDVDLGEK